jgi:hypothetical protein
VQLLILFCQILERISVLTFAVQYHSICANFVVQLFKMEDVSVGLWVGQYGQENHLQYENSARFAQAGCISDYLTAHYQSPHQMMCLWDKLLATGLAECC